jgi:hypothetical protein
VQVFTELISAFQIATSDESIHALILTGTGKYFTSGADLKESAHALGGGSGRSWLWPPGRFMVAMLAFPKVSVCACVRVISLNSKPINWVIFVCIYVCLVCVELLYVSVRGDIFIPTRLDYHRCCQRQCGRHWLHSASSLRHCICGRGRADVDALRTHRHRCVAYLHHHLLHD